MGMFNSIFTNILCPVRNEISKNTEIQIKWQEKEIRELTSYHKFDILENILGEYNNTWIRTDYICNVCSKFTDSKNGYKFIKTEDQQRHYVFIKIENAQITEILTATEFESNGVKNFVEYY